MLGKQIQTIRIKENNLIDMIVKQGYFTQNQHITDSLFQVKMDMCFLSLALVL